VADIFEAPPGILIALTKPPSSTAVENGAKLDPAKSSETFKTEQQEQIIEIASEISKKPGK
jgi:hypothetical protein